LKNVLKITEVSFQLLCILYINKINVQKSNKSCTYISNKNINILLIKKYFQKYKKIFTKYKKIFQKIQKNLTKNTKKSFKKYKKSFKKYTKIFLKIECYLNYNTFLINVVLQYFHVSMNLRPSLRKVTG
jgi:hypothetical protein